MAVSHRASFLAGKFIKTEGCASSRSEAIARRIAETGWSAFERV